MLLINDKCDVDEGFSSNWSLFLMAKMLVLYSICQGKKMVPVCAKRTK
jgi:hypothetical protein